MKSLQTLKNLISLNSYTQNKKGVDAIGAYIATELPFMKRDITQSSTFGDLNLFSSQKNDPSKPRILLCGHSDTVHSPEKEFTIKEEGNKLFGPGTQDMKGGLVVIIETLKYLHEVNKLENIQFVVIPDEEISSTAHEKKLEELYKKTDIALVYEASTANVKVNGEIKDYTPSRRTVVVERKGIGVATFKISAPGGHSGVLTEKHQRISAINEAAHKILAIEEVADYFKGTTTNPGVINGGTVFNALAQECTIKADFRVLTTEESQRVKKAYETIAAKSFVPGTITQIHWELFIDPMEKTQKNVGLAEKLQKLGTEKGIEIIQETRGGGSDANTIAQFGVTVIDGLGPQGDGEHTDKEFLYIDSLEPSIELSRGLVDLLLSNSN